MALTPVLDYADIAFCAGRPSAIALDVRQHEIYISDGARLARIPWVQVRTWEWKLQGANRINVIGGNLGHHMQAGVLNAGERLQASRESGLFLAGQDTRQPVWQFMCERRSTLERWHEILTQLDEGRLR